MKYKSITVITNHFDADLVASAMFDAGAGGVSIVDRQDFADLVKSDVIWDYIDEDALLASDEVKVSTVVELDDVHFLKRLQDRLQEMKARGGVSYGEITTGEIDAADYENEWKKYYNPIKTDAITIVPTWIKYQPADGEKIIKLDPGMAFGTGSHATTRMCLDMMRGSIDGKSVIDVGCGSGILGVAAAKLGAKSVYMCDIDAQAIEFATANAAQNGVDAEIEVADLIQGNRKADVVLANLTADILARLAGGLSKHISTGGEAIISGIIDSRLDETKQVFIDAGYDIIEERAMDDWRALRLKPAR